MDAALRGQGRTRREITPLGTLFALGVGWNFLFTGGTALLTSTYRPEEKNKAQGAMDTCVFATPRRRSDALLRVMMFRKS